MGNSQHNPVKTASSLTEPSISGNKLKPMRERIRYGVCSVKIAPISNGQRRPSERFTSYFVTPRGAIIHGTQCNPQLIKKGTKFSFFPFFFFFFLIICF
jgi:hypothetical protein